MTGNGDFKTGGFMYAVAIGIIAVVVAESVFFMVKAWKQGKKLGISKETMKNTVFSSALFSIAPAVSILTTVIVLAGALLGNAFVGEQQQRLAVLLRGAGYDHFIIAGGETSSVVSQALAVKGFAIGPQIAPGVPWVRTLDRSLSLALKSGNFGDEGFFTRALSFIPQDARS